MIRIIVIGDPGWAQRLTSERSRDIVIVSEGFTVAADTNLDRLSESDMSQNVAARKVRVTAQSVAFLALTEGADAVATLHAKPGCEIAPATFDAACELLAGQPQVREALEALRSDLFGEGGSGERGRPAAKIGESRTYRVQEVNDSGAFIRLPVANLGLAKGATATVTFDNGVIRVTA